MCDAIRYGDTTMCGTCGTQWDTNDPEPPACKVKFQPPYIIDPARSTPYVNGHFSSNLTWYRGTWHGKPRFECVEPKREDQGI